MTNSTTKEIPFYKDLTMKELKRGEKKKHFFIKSGVGIIFPMNGKFAIVIKGLHDSEKMPLIDEVRTAHLLNLLGKDGWKEYYFDK